MKPLIIALASILLICGASGQTGPSLPTIGTNKPVFKKAVKKLVAPKTITADKVNKPMAVIRTTTKQVISVTPPLLPGQTNVAPLPLIAKRLIMVPTVVVPPAIKTNWLTVSIPIPLNGVNTTNRYWRRVQTSKDLKTWTDVLTNGVPLSYEENSGYTVTNTFNSTNGAMFIRTRKVGTP